MTDSTCVAAGLIEVLINNVISGNNTAIGQLKELALNTAHIAVLAKINEASAIEKYFISNDRTLGLMVSHEAFLNTTSAFTCSSVVALYQSGFITLAQVSKYDSDTMYQDVEITDKGRQALFLNRNISATAINKLKSFDSSRASNCMTRADFDPIQKLFSKINELTAEASLVYNEVNMGDAFKPQLSDKMREFSVTPYPGFIQDAKRWLAEVCEVFNKANKYRMDSVCSSSCSTPPDLHEFQTVHELGQILYDWECYFKNKEN